MIIQEKQEGNQDGKEFKEKQFRGLKRWLSSYVHFLLLKKI